jgi:hypothetical protein
MTGYAIHELKRSETKVSTHLCRFVCLRGLSLLAGLLIWGCLAVGVTFVQAQSAQAPSQSVQSMSRPPADPNKFAVIISGASGDEAFAKQFAEWTTRLRRALIERLGFGEGQLKVLAEKQSEGMTGTANAEEVRRAFEALRTTVGPESTVFIFFIGHGTFDGKQAKFNLVGPDLPASAYSSLIGALSARRIVIFNMASASGEFVKPLAAKGRIIVSATRSGQEQNATRFAEHFIAALTEPEADADKNGRISVLEAFNYATPQIAAHYSRSGRLATEHALIEDNGDGLGHEKAEGGDGALARVTYLDSLTIEQAAASVAAAKLIKERTRLEEEVEQLKTRKSELPPTEYENALEKLLIELAKVSRDIRKGSR